MAKIDKIAVLSAIMFIIISVLCLIMGYKVAFLVGIIVTCHIMLFGIIRTLGKAQYL
jgi:hypothetical protein